MMRYRTTLFSVALLASPATAQTATPMVSLTDGRAIANVGQVTVGDKGALDNATGLIGFAGHTVTLAAFSGVLGFSSDVGYLIVASGTAQVGGKTARSGQVILFGAFGAKPVISRFDARHYAATLSSAARQWAPAVAQALDRVAASQKTAMFLGLYQRDGARLPTQGDAARRNLLGAPAVQATRFSGEADQAQVEYEVLTMLVRALVDRDAATLAPLIDPLPFGGAGLDSMGQEARLAYAQMIVTAADWPVRLDGVAPIRMTKPGVWVLQSATGPTFVSLRGTRDFVFVQSVQPGETK